MPLTADKHIVPLHANMQQSMWRMVEQHQSIKNTATPSKIRIITGGLLMHMHKILIGS